MGRSIHRGGTSAAFAGSKCPIRAAWTAAIPDGWHVVPLRAVADYEVSNVDKKVRDGELPVRLCNYVDVYKNEFITLDLDFMEATAGKDEITKFRLQIGDVLITKDSESWDDIGVPALVQETADDLICGYHLARIRPRPAQIDGGFLLRCLQAKPIRLHLELSANGVIRFGLPKGRIGLTPLPLPPLATQRAIADYLDGETALIDALIAAKRKLLAILAEKRRAQVTDAVTRGLDPSVPMRDSGIPWLGEIPAHWGVTRLKFVADVQGGLALGKKYGTAEPLQECPYLRVANVQDGFLDLLEVRTVKVSEHDAQSCRLQAGDVLMNEGGDADKLGRGAIWRGEIEHCLHQNHVFAVRPRAAISEWLNLWTSSEGAKAFFESRAKQSTKLASISVSNLKELPIPCPPPGEQRSIVLRVASQTQRIDDMAGANCATIQLLQERRQAIIAAAVTGQVELEGPPGYGE